MTILTLLVTLALIGFVLWLITTYVPMPPPFKTALVVLTILVVVIWVVRLLGVLSPRL